MVITAMRREPFAAAAFCTWECRHPQDLPGLPLALLKQDLKVPGGLAQIEDLSEGHISHRVVPAGYRP